MSPMEKSLDRKLRALRADPAGSKEFIIADAKDADMAFGVGAPGRSPERHDQELRFRTLAEYRAQIRSIAQSGLVDIMLMSASTCEALTIGERLFDNSPVTPAARANDTTDIHILRGGRIHEAPSRPFRSASLDHIQCGHLDCSPEERRLGADLGLYSVTFNNDMELDHETLTQFKLFREESERKQFRYFLEVFDPNLPDAVCPQRLAQFINDAIARMLAGVAGAGRPQFLKIVYHGPQAMEELVRFDPNLIVGILGGSAGTTLDAFQLIHQAQKYGARVALFGRKINQAESQLAFVHFLRLITDGVLEPVEAVRAYHSVLEKLGITPHRPLDKDLELQTGVMSYGGSGVTVSAPAANPRPAKPRASTSAPAASVTPATPGDNPVEPAREAPPVTQAAAAAPESKGRKPAGTPDFARMTSQERLAYHRARLFGTDHG